MVFADSGNTRIIIYSLLVGSVLTLLNASGGVDGFVKLATSRKLVTNRRQAQLVPLLLGILITVESSITALIAGTVGRPLTDKYRVSREKLAYICDSTSAPICMLVPLNGWGAMVIGLLAVQGVESPVAVLLQSLLWNFYPVLALVIVIMVVLTGRDLGSMRKAEKRAIDTGQLLGENAQPMVSDEIIAVTTYPQMQPNAWRLGLPIATMVLAIIGGIYVTGTITNPGAASSWEIIKASSGSTAVLWAVISSLAVQAVLSVGKSRLAFREFLDLVFSGMGGMIPVVTLLIFAFALGNTVRELGTGAFAAQLIGGAAGPKTALSGLFILSCFMAFATGTSWGTFALMVPIAVPLAAGMGAPLPMYLAATLGGGIFGDHCSPISDTTIISSMAAASDHVDHVRTQLPYALLGAAGAILLYLILG
jgi:Na+/H+ antiporter NhaC